MKKLLVLLFISLSLGSLTAQAQQGGGDPAAMMQRMKERMKPGLMEKAGLTDAQADQVIQIQFDSRQEMRGLRDLSEEDRKKKMEDIQVANTKKYKAIPLTDDQVKALNAYMDEMRKQQMQRQGGGN